MVLKANKIPLPAWAKMPTNSIYPDFYKAEGYPKVISVPKNKSIIFETDILQDIQPRIDDGKLRNPLP